MDGVSRWWGGGGQGETGLGGEEDRVRQDWGGGGKGGRGGGAPEHKKKKMERSGGMETTAVGTRNNTQKV